MGEAPQQQPGGRDREPVRPNRRRRDLRPAASAPVVSIEYLQSRRRVLHNLETAARWSAEQEQQRRRRLRQLRDQLGESGP